MIFSKEIAWNLQHWIEEQLKPETCSSDELIYNEMESQSAYSLPIIYVPFDGRKRSHWADRGAMFDFLFSTKGFGKKLLDFGPGDGWPSLIVAPYVKEVIGVDASQKRIEICMLNASKLGIKNVKFVHYTAGSSLPFQDNEFDGIMAASSIEQTPNPKDTIKEIYRVLKPGGRIRIRYESLNQYKDKKEFDYWLFNSEQDKCKLILYFRNIEKEEVVQFTLTITMAKEMLNIPIDSMNIDWMQSISTKIIECKKCITYHPNGKSYISMLQEANFKKVLPTHNGIEIAQKIYDFFSDKSRPTDLEIIDSVLREPVKNAIEKEGDIDSNPMITGEK